MPRTVALAHQALTTSLSLAPLVAAAATAKPAVGTKQMVRVCIRATTRIAPLTLISSRTLAAAIYLELSLMGFKAWYDNRADDLTKEVRMVLACLRVRNLLQQPMQAATD